MSGGFARRSWSGRELRKAGQEPVAELPQDPGAPEGLGFRALSLSSFFEDQKREVQIWTSLEPHFITGWTSQKSGKQGTLFQTLDGS